MLQAQNFKGSSRSYHYKSFSSAPKESPGALISLVIIAAAGKRYVSKARRWAFFPNHQTPASLSHFLSPGAKAASDDDNNTWQRWPLGAERAAGNQRSFSFRPQPNIN